MTSLVSLMLCLCWQSPTPTLNVFPYCAAESLGVVALREGWGDPAQCCDASPPRSWHGKEKGSAKVEESRASSSTVAFFR